MSLFPPPSVSYKLHHELVMEERLKNALETIKHRRNLIFTDSTFGERIRVDVLGAKDSEWYLASHDPIRFGFALLYRSGVFFF